MRKDKRIKNLSGIGQIILDLKPNRCDSDVYINQKMDLTELVKYIDKKKKTNKDVTYFHAFVTAIAKVLYNRPKLNYYVQNRHLFEHKDIVISFVAKVSFDDKSEEVMIMVPCEENDNINTIGTKIIDKVSAFRKKTTKKEGANDAIDILAKLPNIIRVPLVGFLKWTDKVGLLPSSLTKDNVYYSSIMVSNLGSIKCGAIYHNLTNFGNCSSLITMGEIKDTEVIIDGKKEIRKLCEFGMNFDERIADGYYFAKSAKMFQYLFDNPKLLEEELSKEIPIKEIK